MRLFLAALAGSALGANEGDIRLKGGDEVRLSAKVVFFGFFFGFKMHF